MYTPDQWRAMGPWRSGAPAQNPSMDTPLANVPVLHNLNRPAHATLQLFGPQGFFFQLVAISFAAVLEWAL